MTVNRRGFLKSVVAAQAGAALSTAAARQTRAPADVVVVGAGAFGAWTAFYLRQLGARVRLVDAYGPGNARSSRERTRPRNRRALPFTIATALTRETIPL